MTDIKDRLLKALEEVDFLIHGKRFRMSIPVRDDDSDILLRPVLVEALNEIDRLRAEVERLRKIIKITPEELDKLKTLHAAALDAIERPKQHIKFLEEKALDLEQENKELKAENERLKQTAPATATEDSDVPTQKME